MLVQSGPLRDLAQSLVGEANAGRGARQSIDTRDVAFGWASNMAPIVAGHVNSIQVSGSSFGAVIVNETGTPAAVAEGGSKPTLASITNVDVPIKKYPGQLAGISTEKVLFTDALIPAITSVLVRQALIGFDKDVIATMSADAGQTGTGSTWSAAILDGIANVIQGGYQPDCLVLSSSAFATAVESQTAGAGYQLDYSESIPVLLGLKVVIASGATTEAFVLDSSSVTVAEGPGPFAMVDPYTSASTNQLSVFGEVFAGVVVNAPNGVAALTVA